MARAWAQDWNNRATSYHRNRDDVIEFSRFFNTRYPSAQRIGEPRQVTLDNGDFYSRVCDSPRGLWGQ
jgi:hypothetical protein